MRSALLLLTAFFLTAAPPEDRGLGTWIFVPEKSTYESGPAPKQSRRQWVLRGEKVQFLHDGVSADGKVFHTEFTAPYDNLPVPFLGGTLYDSVALRWVNPSVVEQTFRLKGQVTVTATRTISDNGRYMTIDSRGQRLDATRFKNLLVYRRQ